MIDEEDQFGNLETGDNTTVVTVGLAIGTGPLLGTTTATVAGGVATFTNLADDRAETIALKFTSPGLSSPTSASIVVNPAAASQLVIHTPAFADRDGRPGIRAAAGGLRGGPVRQSGDG